MKILVFASPDGDIDLVNKILAENPDVDMGICLGDLCLSSVSTPLEYFLRKKFRFQGKQIQKAMEERKYFIKPIYFIYGSLDDPFIPINEMKLINFFPLWSSISSIMSSNEDKTNSIVRKFGFMSGYYNPRKFQKSNSSRRKMSRERKSLALCLEDFQNIRPDFDFLFTYESPVNIPIVNFGCARIYDLFLRSNSKIMFHGHHRTFKHTKLGEKHIFSTGELKQGYYIFDSFNLTVKEILGENKKEFVISN